VPVELTLSITKGKVVVFLAIYSVITAGALLTETALAVIVFIAIKSTNKKVYVSPAVTIFEDIT